MSKPYDRETTCEETFLVVDVATGAEGSSALRAYMTGFGVNDDDDAAADAADDAEATLPPDVFAWCEQHVLIERDGEFALPPPVFEHKNEKPHYSGGGVGIEVDEVPPPHVLLALKDRAAACLSEGNLLGFRLVKRRVVLVSEAV